MSQHFFDRRQRFQLKRQADELAGKTVVSLMEALATRAAATGFCRQPFPDPALFYATSQVADQKANEFGTSLLSLGILAILQAI
jgi:hypothetical protein